VTQGITYSAIEFDDVKNSDWFKEDLNYCVEEGLINGYSDGTFKPNKEISRAEFITVVIAAVFEKEENGSTLWYSRSYNKALNNDLIDVDFHQNDADASISREEMAVVISQVLGMSSVPLDESKAKEDISDYNNISEENKEAVLDTYKSGIISGFPDGSFKPKETLKRSQLSKVTALINQLDRKAYNMPEFAEVIDTVDKESVYEKKSETVEIVEGITFDQSLFADWDDWDEYSESMTALEIISIESVKVDQDKKTITFYIPHVAEGLFWEFAIRGKIRDKVGGAFINVGLHNIDFKSIHGATVSINYEDEFNVSIAELEEILFTVDIESSDISQITNDTKDFKYIEFDVRQ